MNPGQLEALEAVVARTRHERFRQLCDESHPDYAPGCPDLMIRMAAELTPAPAQEPAPEPPRAAGIARLRRFARLAKSCPYREQTCGCNNGKCFAARGSGLLDPTKLYPGDCANCLSEMPGLS